MMGMVDQERLVQVTSGMLSWNALRLGYGNPCLRSAKSHGTTAGLGPGKKNRYDR